MRVHRRRRRGPRGGAGRRRRPFARPGDVRAGPSPCSPARTPSCRDWPGTRRGRHPGAPPAARRRLTARGGGAAATAAVGQPAAGAGPTTCSSGGGDPTTTWRRPNGASPCPCSTSCATSPSATHRRSDRGWRRRARSAPAASRRRPPDVPRRQGAGVARSSSTGVETGLVPHRTATTNAARDEEARLLHVAVTRAADRLVLTWAARRGGYQRRPSPLIAGLDTGDAARVAAAGRAAGRAGRHATRRSSAPAWRGGPPSRPASCRPSCAPTPTWPPSRRPARRRRRARRRHVVGVLTAARLLPWAARRPGLRLPPTLSRGFRPARLAPPRRACRCRCR